MSPFQLFEPTEVRLTFEMVTTEDDSLAVRNAAINYFNMANQINARATRKSMGNSTLWQIQGNLLQMNDILDVDRVNIRGLAIFIFPREVVGMPFNLFDQNVCHPIFFANRTKMLIHVTKTTLFGIMESITTRGGGQ